MTNLSEIIDKPESFFSNICTGKDHQKALEEVLTHVEDLKKARFRRGLLENQIYLCLQNKEDKLRNNLLSILKQWLQSEVLQVEFLYVSYLQKKLEGSETEAIKDSIKNLYQRNFLWNEFHSVRYIFKAAERLKDFEMFVYIGKLFSAYALNVTHTLPNCLTLPTLYHLRRRSSSIKDKLSPVELDVIYN